MTTPHWSRRAVLKSLGLAASAAALPATTAPRPRETDAAAEPLPAPSRHAALAKPVTAITLGAGRRGRAYGGYAVRHPQDLRLVGVAEPVPIRNERYAQTHGIDPGNRFTTWEHVFDRPKFADAVIISTPDQLHYGPCLAALEAGYDVLLEKPIAPSEQECRDILAAASRTGRIVAVCHVLRYAPYFVKLRELMLGGAIGKVVSLQHIEPMGYMHMSHSYVRGPWHNSRLSTPSILAKSCHDLDILRWMVDRPCRKIQAFAHLSWFTRENAPPGSTGRCTDGCAVERDCPYSALRIYYHDRRHLDHFDLPEDGAREGDAILELLRTTDYGRCVYRMDNDQPDHYVANILFDGNVTASFSMEAFTSYSGRRTRVMGSMGDIVGDMSAFTLTDFRTRKKTEWRQPTDGHGGGDFRLVADWVQAVARQDASLLTSTIAQSIESHIMGFMAERSRAENKVMDVEV
jgi:predicted dehydrogenase